MNALPAGPLPLDTGIYIRFSRREAYPWLAGDAQIFQRTILSSVVAAELYAGTRSQREKRALDELCRAHHALGRFSTPPASTWIDAGVLVRRARGTLGKMNFAHHFRDVLIAMETARTKATLVTENVADFERWKGLLASAGKTLKLFHPS